MRCPWPDCEAELEGIGRYCETCRRYAADVSVAPTGVEIPPVAQVLVIPMPLSVNRMYRSVAGVRKGLVDAVLAYVNGSGSWKDVLAQLYVSVKVSKEGRLYRKQVVEWLEAQRTTVLAGDVRLAVTFYFGRRGSDLDNRHKVLLDVLQGALYENDVQITDFHTVKRYDKENPRAVVVAEPDDGSAVLDPGAEFNYELPF